jgi:hypothetical protein
LIGCRIVASTSTSESEVDHESDQKRLDKRNSSRTLATIPKNGDEALEPSNSHKGKDEYLNAQSISSQSEDNVAPKSAANHDAVPIHSEDPL